MIWFLEGQASQRDVIIGARDALPESVRIIASHRQQRSEITGLADVALQEPLDNQERIDWVLEHARSLGAKVIVAGRVGGLYEAQRARFIAEGLDLVTGGTSLQTFMDVDNKMSFHRGGRGGGAGVHTGDHRVQCRSLRDVVGVWRSLHQAGGRDLRPGLLALQDGRR